MYTVNVVIGGGHVVCLLCRGCPLLRVFIIRGSTVYSSRCELLWFYQEGASFLFPDVWETFVSPIPEVERGDLISAYYRRLTGTDKEVIELNYCSVDYFQWCKVRDSSTEK